MVTPIDKQAAQIGTQGFLTLNNLETVDVTSADDIEDLKRPTVFLNAQRQWEWIDAHDSLLSKTLYGGTRVFATWQEALEAGIEDDAKEINLDREGLAGKLRDLDSQEAHLEAVRQFLSSQRANA